MLAPPKRFLAATLPWHNESDVRILFPFALQFRDELLKAFPLTLSPSRRRDQ
jgi:hypothetical protein